MAPAAFDRVVHATYALPGAVWSREALTLYSEHHRVRCSELVLDALGPPDRLWPGRFPPHLRAQRPARLRFESTNRILALRENPQCASLHSARRACAEAPQSWGNL